MLKFGRKHQLSMKVNTEQHTNWVIMTMHELFHLKVDVDIRSWGVIVYVAYIGPKCNAGNYTYEVCMNRLSVTNRLWFFRKCLPKILYLYYDLKHIAQSLNNKIS